MRALVSVAALLVALPACARDVQLNGDYGCVLYANQLRRLELMQVVYEGSAAKARGVQTAEGRRASDAATAEMVSISNTDCRPLTGRFKVLETRPVDGGKALKVQLPKDRYLWVLE